ncbi:hypothetical protein [Yersinia sp. J1]|uniref:hypothetical protein n=1 Tax=Yersinia sp. J1 TaxID=3424774 RepID=UPI003D36C008
MNEVSCEASGFVRRRGWLRLAPARFDLVEAVEVKYSQSKYQLKPDPISKFKVQSSKFKVQSSKFKVQSSKFKVQSSYFENHKKHEGSKIEKFINLLPHDKIE